MNRKEFISKNKLGLGLLIGVVIGINYGVLNDDLAQGTGLGASFGIILGAFWSRKDPK